MDFIYSIIVIQIKNKEINEEKSELLVASCFVGANKRHLQKAKNLVNGPSTVLPTETFYDS